MYIFSPKLWKDKFIDRLSKNLQDVFVIAEVSKFWTIMLEIWAYKTLF